jgi:hypothetical protein
MVIDAAKGIEARTRKLFEVCRLRDIPIVTFVNKIDREARDPFELLDEIEKTLALDTAPMTWPIGAGATSPAPTTSRDNAVRHRRPRTDAEGQRPGSPTASPSCCRNDERDASRGDGARPRGLPAVRPRGLPRGAPDAGLLRQRAAQFRRARPDRRAGRASRRRRARRRPTRARSSRRAEDDRLRVQDPGEHGPQPPRPHRLRARVLGQAHARHEGEARAHRQARWR